MLEAERHHRGLHGAAGLFVTEDLEEPRAQLVGVDLPGIDHQVGTVPYARQQRSLVSDRVHHATCRLRVPATSAFEPADEDVVRSVQKEDPYAVASGKQSVNCREHVVEVATAAPHDEGHPLHLRTRPVDQLGHLGDQC